MKRATKSLLRAVAFALFGGWGLLRRALSGRRDLPPPGRVRSILAIRLDLLGDLLFSLPAFGALREAMPEARVTALVLPYTAGILAGHPWVDRVIAVDVNRWRRPAAWIGGDAWRELRAAMAEVRSDRYDLCISFYGSVGAAFSLLSGARYLVGYGSEGFPFNFDLALPGRRYRSRRHESEYCLELARGVLSRRGAGVQAAAVATSGPGRPSGPDAEPATPATPEASRIQVDPAAAERVGVLLAESGAAPGDRLVALHPGALNMGAKRWFPGRWAAVADRVQRELGLRVVLVGSGSEAPLVEEVARAMETPAIGLAGKTTVPELVALLARCRLFLGGDSGPLHLASALGVPSVSVYGPTDPAVTGPLGPRARVLRSGVECSPCYDPRRAPVCRRGDLICMVEVSADAVFQAVRQVVADGQ